MVTGKVRILEPALQGSDPDAPFIILGPIVPWEAPFPCASAEVVPPLICYKDWIRMHVSGLTRSRSSRMVSLVTLLVGLMATSILLPKRFLGVLCESLHFYFLSLISPSKSGPVISSIESRVFFGLLRDRSQVRLPR